MKLRLGDNMSFFSKLKFEQICNFQNIISDIDFFLNKKLLMEPHKESANIFKKWVTNEMSDVENCNIPSLKKWQDLLFSVYSIDRFERYLSNISLRFGPIKPNAEKSYQYLDKLCYDILERAGFKEPDKYPNIIVCGGHSYSNTLGMNQICCRTTDIYRCWNWGIIGHELGHTISRYYFGRLLFKNELSTKKLPKQSNPSPEIIASNWRNEVIADIIGTLTTGPSFLSAHMMNPRLWCFLPTDVTELIDIFSTHPPDEVRFQIETAVLEDMGLSGIISIDEIKNIHEYVDVSEASEEDLKIFEDRIEDIESILPSFLELFETKYSDIKEKIKIFSPEDWTKSVEVGKILLEQNSIPSFDFSANHVINGLLSIKPEMLSGNIEKQLLERAFNFMDYN